MSALHAPRAPWVLLAVFCAAALIFFAVAVDRDIALIGAMAPSAERAAQVVRRPIPIEAKQAAGAEREPLQALPAPPPKPAPSAAAPKKETAPPPVQTTAADTSGTLLSHTLQRTDTGFEAVFRTDRPVSGARTAFMSPPAMWVVDLPGTWKNRSRRELTLGQGAIERIAIGEHPKYLRVVFYFRDRDQPRPAQSPLVTEEENGFTIVIP